MRTASQINSVGEQLINNGFGLVSQPAAEKIAAAVPESELDEIKSVLDVVNSLVSKGEIEILDVEGERVIE